MMKKLVLLVLIVAIGGSAGWYYYRSGSGPAAAFRAVTVERGDLLTTINATGTIEPEEVVDVGAQVAGMITSFGTDPRGSDRLIDYGSPVEKDTVLARIDESVYRSQVERAQAQVASAKAAVEQADAQVASAQAGVQRAEADLGQMQAKLYQSEREWQRSQKLGGTKAITDTEYDTAQATYRTSKATLAVGEAAVAQSKAALKDAQASVSKAKATLADAEAGLHNAEINLGYCTIKSPVKGVIVDRRVNVGQTVVSSLNAPSLFLIAKDLKRLQVWASVNEADIGNVHSGQPVTFTVDAYPGRVFTGIVAPDQPRLNASMTQNVVTYTVVVNTDNSDGTLLPYLTANLQFEVSKHSKVLLVPNTALRWKPKPEQVVPEARDEFVRLQRLGKGANKAAPGEEAPGGEKAKEPRNKGVLWVEDNGFVRPIKVITGLSDGISTEIAEGDVREGEVVVVGENKSGGGAGTTNPFTPAMFGGKKQQ